MKFARVLIVTTACDDVLSAEALAKLLVVVTPGVKLVAGGITSEVVVVEKVGAPGPTDETFDSDLKFLLVLVVSLEIAADKVNSLDEAQEYVAFMVPALVVNMPDGLCGDQTLLADPIGMADEISEGQTCVLLKVPLTCTALELAVAMLVVNSRISSGLSEAFPETFTLSLKSRDSFVALFLFGPDHWALTA